MQDQLQGAWRIAVQPAAQAPVGVVGAGVMGAGIAQVAAQAGHPVHLLDVREGAAQSAIAQIAKALEGLVLKGRMSADEREALLARIQPESELRALADCALVVEVIVEKLEPKQTLLRDLDALLADDALIASNTSSISVTALANGMRRPERLVGMHFFNPVPLMKLVEVVSGAETDTTAAQSIYALSQRWGKSPVHAKSTPGFIVNRIARPYYAETLALLLEQAGTPAELDRAMRGAGFRMGPCELMDLIGHDTNFLVTQSVFEANFGDKRYMPSLVQKALVDGGRLGRKTGKGFYEGVPPASLPVPSPEQLQSGLVLHQCADRSWDGLMARLHDWLVHKGVAVATCKGSTWSGLALDGLEMHLSSGRTAAHLAFERQHADLVVMDWPVAPDRCDGLALACAPRISDMARQKAANLLRQLGWEPLFLRDAPGLVCARSVAMLVNEAADAVWQGVCDEAAADVAMKLGVNYPAGPFEWLALCGPHAIAGLLDRLFEAYRSERYRVSPMLRQRCFDTTR
ncbi:MAG: 3-hydroxyacyl-CoA dehydrogenase [Burkholderiaceae bacterium]|nr:3-hydroxyacyl-CoA dehydrogenase [Roseateles sp.]MBV8470342.1 3-hydroxyacyl-CoA dehydrogenase [Burkholderiaceae bacterium]